MILAYGGTSYDGQWLELSCLSPHGHIILEITTDIIASKVSVTFLQGAAKNTGE